MIKFDSYCPDSYTEHRIHKALISASQLIAV